MQLNPVLACELSREDLINLIRQQLIKKYPGLQMELSTATIGVQEIVEDYQFKGIDIAVHLTTNEVK